MPITPGSFTQLPPNSTGPKLATGPTYTENAQTVQDEKVILGENYLASYTVITNSIVLTTSLSHVLQLMAGASKIVRVRRIEVHQSIVATAAAIGLFDVLRLSTAGTGGGALTPNPLDPADAASGATVMTLPTVKGTETVGIGRANPYLMQTVGASTPFVNPIVVWDFDRPRSKPLIIAAGVTNGIAIKNGAAYAGASVTVMVWFDEIAWA